MTRRSLAPRDALRPSHLKSLRSALAEERQLTYDGHLQAKTEVMMNEEGEFSLRLVMAGSYITVPFCEADIVRLKRSMILFKKTRDKVGSLSLAQAGARLKQLPAPYRKRDRE